MRRLLTQWVLLAFCVCVFVQPVQSQETSICEDIADISDSPYQSDICALLQNGITTTTSNNDYRPSAQITLKEEIETILKALNLYSAAGQFSGGVCPNDSYLSFAIDRKIITNTTCPNPLAKRRMSSTIATIGNALIKYGQEPLNHFWQYSINYFGPASLLVPSSPYGISKNYFKYAFGVNALPNFNANSDPALTAYGLQYVTRGQLAWIINKGLVKRDNSVQVANSALYIADAQNRLNLDIHYTTNSPMPRGDAIGIAMRLLKVAGLINYPTNVSNPFISVPADYEYLPELVEARAKNIITSSQGTFIGPAGTWVFDYQKYVSRKTMASWLYYIGRLDPTLKLRYDTLYNQNKATTTFDPTDTGATSNLKLATVTLKMEALPLASQNVAGQFNTLFNYIPEAEESILTIYKMMGIEPIVDLYPPQTDEFCPAYTESALFAERPRANRIILSPSAHTNDYQWLITISQAGPNTEVLLRDGTYYFPGQYDLPYNQMQINSNITIRSLSGLRDNVVIVGKGFDTMSEGFLLVGQNVVIADISITNMRNHGVAIKGELGAEAAHIYNVNFYDIGTQMIKGAPDAQNGSSNNIIACSSFGYTSLDKSRGDYIAAIDLHRFHNTLIRDNKIYNFMGDGSGCEVDVSCGSYITHPAILIWNQSSGTIIERNTFLNNFRSIALGLTSGHTGGIIRNNFIYRTLPGDAGIELQNANGAKIFNNTVRITGYNGAIEARVSSNIEIRNNLLSSPFYDRGGLTGELVTNNVGDARDQDFTTPDSPHLRTGSRLIGAGLSLLEVTTDIDGDTRDVSNDIGADQWTSDTNTPPPPPSETSVTITDVVDTWLGSRSEEASSSYGGATTLQTYSTPASGGNSRTALLKFDLSDIPSGASITEARLEFYIQSIEYISNPTVTINRVSQNWIEGTDTGAWDNLPVDGANWTSRGPDLGNWNNAGGDVSEQACQLTLTNAAVNTCDITTLVQQWVNNTTPNYGIRLANMNIYNDAINIASSESSTLTNRPKLVIKYTTDAAVPPPPPPPPALTDDDNDGVLNNADNCPLIANSDQGNLDGDTMGNACDTDDDNDNVVDTNDNCPYNANANQSDRDGDSLGDVCDPTPDSTPPAPGSNSDDLRATKLQRIATKVSGYTNSIALSQPTDIQASHRNGQTFLTWTENSSVTGENYIIYRSSTPINSGSLSLAIPIAVIPENSSYYRTEATRTGSVQQRFIITDNGPQLNAGTGFFVNTPHEAGDYYYAIVTSSSNQANLVTFTSGNSISAALTETTNDPKPILVAMRQSNGRTGRIYTQFMDYHNWNETMHGYAYNYSVSVDDNYNPSGTESMQVAIHMEGKNSRYDNVEIYGDGIWIRIDAPYFSSYAEQDWYWGYSCNNDFQNATRQTVDNGPICNFSEVRILRAIKDTLQDPFYANHADPERIYAYGHSMGASGVLHLAMHYPDIISAVYASQGMTDYSTDPVWQTENTNRWGSLNTNNPVLNLGIKWLDGSNTASTIRHLNGMGIWDYLDHKTIACDPSNADMEISYIISTHGTNDGSIVANSQGYPFYDCLNQGHRGFQAQVDNAYHGWQQYEPASPIDFRPLIDPWGAWEAYDFPVTESYPAFSHASNSDYGARSGLADYNLDLNWDPDSIIDSVDRYEISINSTSGNQLVDITPRRLQHFMISPNTTYRWEYRNSSGALITHGTATSTTEGFITIEDLTVTNAANRLIIIR